jgi:hypothetical protein
LTGQRNVPASKSSVSDPRFGGYLFRDYCGHCAVSSTTGIEMDERVTDKRDVWRKMHFVRTIVTCTLVPL